MTALRDIWLHIRIDQDERDELARIAQAAGTNVSDLIRCHTPGLKPPRVRRPRMPAHVAALIRALASVQVNLLQISESPCGPTATRVYAFLDELKAAVGLALASETLPQAISYGAVTAEFDAHGRNLNRTALLWNTGEYSDMSNILHEIEILAKGLRGDLDQDRT